MRERKKNEKKKMKTVPKYLSVVLLKKSIGGGKTIRMERAFC